VTWIRVAAARAVLSAAESRGLDRVRLLAGVGVDSLPTDAWSLVPLAVHFGLIEGCVRQLDDPGFVIDIAEHVPVETYDVMGFAMRSAPDLATAVEIGQRYQSLYTSASLFEVKRSAAALDVWFRPSGPLPLAARCATESAVGQWLQVARQLAGTRLVPTYVGFRHKEPKSVARHRAFYGVEPEWSAPLAAIRFHGADAALPVRQADTSLHSFLLRAAEAALAEHRPLDSFVEQVRTVAAELLPSGKLDVAHVAARLATTERTLRRRLTEQGTTFLELRDTLRAELARKYLAEKALPIAEIAFLLDFADERAFRRSFQRWTGKSPAQYRSTLRDV